jgi:hypothetical protein
LLIAAAALALLPGCAWIRGARHARRDPPAAVETDPPGKSQVAQDQQPAAKVKLDGSAANDGAPQTPNAPAIGAMSAQANANADNVAGGSTVAKNSNSGQPNDLTTDTEGQTGDIVPATASDPGAHDITTADVRSPAETGSGPRNGESLTNLPGSFDVVGDGVKIEQGVVAATVNGQPIFVEDVLRDVPPEFIKERERHMSKRRSAKKDPASTC